MDPNQRLEALSGDVTQLTTNIQAWSQNIESDIQDIKTQLTATSEWRQSMEAAIMPLQQLEERTVAHITSTTDVLRTTMTEALATQFRQFTTQNNANMSALDSTIRDNVKNMEQRINTIDKRMRATDTQQQATEDRMESMQKTLHNKTFQPPPEAPKPNPAVKWTRRLSNLDRATFRQFTFEFRQFYELTNLSEAEKKCVFLQSLDGDVHRIAMQCPQDYTYDHIVNELNSRLRDDDVNIERTLLNMKMHSDESVISFIDGIRAVTADWTKPDDSKLKYALREGIHKEWQRTVEMITYQNPDITFNQLCTEISKFVGVFYGEYYGNFGIKRPYIKKGTLHTLDRDGNPAHAVIKNNRIQFDEITDLSQFVEAFKHLAHKERFHSQFEQILRQAKPTTHKPISRTNYRRQTYKRNPPRRGTGINEIEEEFSHTDDEDNSDITATTQQKTHQRARSLNADDEIFTESVNEILNFEGTNCNDKFDYSLSTTRTSTLMYARIRIQQTYIQALVDTGASRSVLPHQKAVKLGLSINTSEKITLLGFAGHETRTKGTTTVAMTIHDRAYLHTFHVSSATNIKTILGNDFFKANKIKVDPAAHSIQLEDNTSVPCYTISTPEKNDATAMRVVKRHQDATLPTKESKTNAGYIIRSSNPATIPANSFTDIQTGLSINFPKATHGRIIALNDMKLQFHTEPVICENTSSDPITLRVRNITNKRIHLPSKTPMAYLIIEKNLHLDVVEASAASKPSVSDNHNAVNSTTLVFRLEDKAKFFPAIKQGYIHFPINRNLWMKPDESKTFYMPIQCSEDIHLIPRIHPTLRIETGFQPTGHYLKTVVTNTGKTLFHIQDKLILTAMKLSTHDSYKVVHKTTEHTLSPVNTIKTDDKGDQRQNDKPPDSVSQWQRRLQEQYPKTCPGLANNYLPGVSDDRLTLDNFHLYFDQGLAHGNFPAPLITKAEANDVEVFLRNYVAKGILEQAPEPAKLILHPTILIPKRTKSELRLVVDFRPTNKMFSPFPYDVADRAAVLRSIPADMKFFSVLDIADAFYQIRITDPELRNFFGIHVHHQYYRFARLPQGWKNSPAVCQLVYSTVLGSDLSDCCRLYMDDILIFSTDLQGHWQALKRVLSKLNQNNVQINWNKAEIAQPSIDYLGINISHSGLRPSTRLLDKLDSLTEANLTSKNAWQRARGILLQYQHYGPRVTQLIDTFREADPETRRTIIKQLAQRQTKNPPKTTRWRLYTDWSDEAVGYVLKTDNEEPVLWNSRRCNKDERKYSSFLGEISAAHWALHDSQAVWRGAPIELRSDSKSFVTYWPRITKATDVRILRRADYLLSIPDFTVCFTPGEFNDIADFLSRLPRQQKTPKIEPTPTINKITTNEEKLRWIEEAHRGHFCSRKTIQNLLWKNRKWKGMNKEVSGYCARCIPCQRFARRRRYDELRTQVSREPNGLLAMDIIGPLPRGKYRHKFIVTCIDSLTRLGSAKSFRANTADNILEVLRVWTALRGTPKQILVDNGSQFVGNKFRDYCQNKDISIKYTPKYSHKSAGLIERYNGTLNGRIRRLCEGTGRNWTDVITEAVDSINTTVHDITQIPPKNAWEGINHNGDRMTQTQLNDCHKRIYERSIASERKTNCRQAHRIRQKDFKEGDQVWLFDSKMDQRLDAKFDSRWQGPCRVEQRTSKHTYNIILPDGRRQRGIHSDFLRRCHHEHSETTQGTV